MTLVMRPGWKTQMSKCLGRCTSHQSSIQTAAARTASPLSRDIKSVTVNWFHIQTSHKARICFHRVKMLRAIVRTSSSTLWVEIITYQKKLRNCYVSLPRKARTRFLSNEPCQPPSEALVEDNTILAVHSARVMLRIKTLTGGQACTTIRSNLMLTSLHQHLQ